MKPQIIAWDFWHLKARLVFFENLWKILAMQPNLKNVRHYIGLCMACVFFTLLSGCGAPTKSAGAGSGGLPTQTLPPVNAWQTYELPGKQSTQFISVLDEGRSAMRATANASASMLRHRLHVEASDLGKVHFSWKVMQLIENADMAVRERDDSPVRVVLVFEGDRSHFSIKNSMLSELSMAMTGEPLPYATLMYVWCNTRLPGSVILNPRTDRIRKVVVESGESKLGRWLDYERDIRADFTKAFGEPPGALVGVAIMTDTDNTRSQAQAWYGPLALTTAH
jgi:hypothetical protein